VEGNEPNIMKNLVSDPKRWLDKTDSASPREKKIKGVVREYVRIFAGEFEEFKRGMTKKRNSIDMVSNKFAELEGSDIVERHLAEWPETLEIALRKQLDIGEYQWLRTHKGIKWFLEEFPVFRITKSM